MLVWWQKSRYEINYSHFFRGGWRGVLQWCNVRAHKIIISACTIDFRPTFNVPVHTSWLAAATFDLFLRCVWCIILLEKGKHCGVFRGEGCNAHDTCLFPSWCLLSVSLQPFVTKLGIVVHHHERECHTKKWDSIVKVKITVWAYIIKIWQFLLYLLLVLS